jgi:urease accessory protein
MLAGTTLQFGAAIALFSLFGLFHGAAFGDAIASQESAAGTAVLFGYLLGLGCTQYAIALGSGWFSNHVWKAHSSLAVQPRLAGAMVAGVGLFLTLENIEGTVLGMLFG